MMMRVKAGIKQALREVGYRFLDVGLPRPFTPPRPHLTLPAEAPTPAYSERPALQIGVHPDLQEEYHHQYTADKSAWRELGGKHKAEHILTLCQRNGIAPRTILEVGAGEGAILAHLSQAGFGTAYYALEISQSGVERIKARAIPQMRLVETFDGYRLPFADESFDLVILSHVLEHVEFPRQLLRKMKRVSHLQIIEIPLDYHPTVDLEQPFYASYGHVMVYTPALLRFLLRSEGFEVCDDLLGQPYVEAALFNAPVSQHAAIKRKYARIARRFNRANRHARERLAETYTVLTRALLTEALEASRF